MPISGISTAISSYSKTSSTSSSVNSVATLEAQKNRYEQALLSLQGTSAADSSSSTTSSSTQIASIERSIAKITQKIAELKNKAIAETSTANIPEKPEKEEKKSLQEKFGSAYTTSISAEGYDAFIKSQQLNKSNDPAVSLS